MKTGSKILLWVILILLLGGAGFCYVRFFYVFSEGYQTGELNQFTHKGYVFKTYEGRLIQTGYGNKGSNSKTPGAVQSNVFEFSVDDPAIADTLLRCTGKRVELHYKEYFGRLPWRGYNKHIVDRIGQIYDEVEDNDNRGRSNSPEEIYL